jgi:hypothetical protein
MAQSFKHSTNGLTVGTARTLLYGPVSAGVSAIVFAGTFSNLDDTNKLQHTVTLERYDGTTYNSSLHVVPVPYNSASKCPKIVLSAGESLYGTADAVSVIGVDINVLELS